MTNLRYKLLQWLYLKINRGYKPSDIQQICAEEFRKAMEQVDDN